MFKFIKGALIQALEKLTPICELIIVTILPRCLVEEFFSTVPELREMFAYVLCAEDLY